MPSSYVLLHDSLVRRGIDLESSALEAGHRPRAYPPPGDRRPWAVGTAAVDEVVVVVVVGDELKATCNRLWEKEEHIMIQCNSY